MSIQRIIILPFLFAAVGLLGSACGVGGSASTARRAPLAANTGETIQADESPFAPPGSECKHADHCGPATTCLDGWPGGYCTYACWSHEDCGGEGVGYCAGWNGRYPGVCMAACTDDSECRPGYGCTGTSCWPAAPLTED